MYYKINSFYEIFYVYYFLYTRLELDTYKSKLFQERKYKIAMHEMYNKLRLVTNNLTKCYVLLEKL